MRLKDGSCTDGLAAMSEAEVVLRRRAAECQRVFIRLLDELETADRRVGRAEFRAALSHKAAVRPIITELAPSARGRHRSGRRKDVAGTKA